MLSLTNEMVKKYKLPYIFQEQKISSFCEDDYSLNEMNTKNGHFNSLSLFLSLSLSLTHTHLRSHLKRRYYTES